METDLKDIWAEGYKIFGMGLGKKEQKWEWKINLFQILVLNILKKNIEFEMFEIKSGKGNN